MAKQRDGGWENSNRRRLSDFGKDGVALNFAVNLSTVLEPAHGEALAKRKKLRRGALKHRASQCG